MVLLIIINEREIVKNRKSIWLTFLLNQILVAILSAFVYLLVDNVDIIHFVIIAEIISNCIGFTIFSLFSLFRIFWKNKPIEIALVKNLVSLAIILMGTFIGLEIASQIVGLLYENVVLYGDGEQKSVFFFIVLIIALIATFILLTYQSLKTNLEEQVRQNQLLTEMNARAKIKELQSKINPHFLFNTLNTIINLAYKDPVQVEKLVLALSNIYRKVLSLSMNDWITIADELEIIEDYLHIEKIRMGKRLNYSVHIPEEIKRIKIPPLLLEPIVENAVIHGVSPNPGGGKIQIEARRLDHAIRFYIRNTGQDFPEDKLQQPGFGLYSVSERIRLMYNGQGSLKINPNQEGGTEIIVEIPYGA